MKALEIGTRIVYHGKSCIVISIMESKALVEILDTFTGACLILDINTL